MYVVLEVGGGLSLCGEGCPAGVCRLSAVWSVTGGWSVGLMGPGRQPPASL